MFDKRMGLVEVHLIHTKKGSVYAKWVIFRKIFFTSIRNQKFWSYLDIEIRHHLVHITQLGGRVEMSMERQNRPQLPTAGMHSFWDKKLLSTYTFTFDWLGQWYHWIKLLRYRVGHVLSILLPWKTKRICNTWYEHRNDFYFNFLPM